MNNRNRIRNLHDAIAAVCPIDGVSVGDPADRSTWRIDFSETDPPPAERQAAAHNVLANFDMMAPEVPFVITATQFKLALARAQVLPAVENWVKNGTIEHGIIWNSSMHFLRNSTFVAEAAKALNIPDLDGLFVMANQIKP